jgi:hypothetical protein
VNDNYHVYKDAQKNNSKHRPTEDRLEVVGATEEVCRIVDVVAEEQKMITADQ